MSKAIQILAVAAIALVLAACGEKKKSDDIIMQRVVAEKPKGPQRMQGYSDERNVDWIGRTYHVAIRREACDSLPTVEDETGQQFVDNIFTLAVSRSDGSVFYSRRFAKRDVAAYLDDDFRRTGIFEGLVFDRADGDWLVFAASVGHPQTDEYIPLVVRLSRMGELVIQRDTQMDTTPADEEV